MEIKEEEFFYLYHQMINGQLDTETEDMLRQRPNFVDEYRVQMEVAQIVKDAHLLEVKRIAAQVAKEGRGNPWNKYLISCGVITLLGGLGWGFAHFSSSVKQQDELVGEKLLVHDRKKVEALGNKEVSIVPKVKRVVSKHAKADLETQDAKKNVELIDDKALDRQAQYEYLKSLERKDREEIKEKVTEVQKLEDDTESTLDATSEHTEIKLQKTDDLQLPQRESLLFDLVLNVNKQDAVLLPLNVSEGKIKTFGKDGRYYGERVFLSQDQAVWSLQLLQGNVEGVSQINIQITSLSDEVFGQGKVTLLR